MAIEKINICTDSGKIVEATAPVIISASRSTDIHLLLIEWIVPSAIAFSQAVEKPLGIKGWYIS